MKSTCRRLIGLLPVALALSLTQSAQAAICINETTAIRHVRGIVVSFEDEVDLLSGVVVHLKRGQFETEATTDDDGYFAFSRLPPGDYELRTKLAGFQDTYGEVRLREDGASDRVLVIDMRWVPEWCGAIQVKTWQEARRLQQEARRDSRRGRGRQNPTRQTETTTAARPGGDFRSWVKP